MNNQFLEKKLLKCNKAFFLFLFLLSSGMAIAQTTTISGTITEAEGKTPLPGVNIIEKGTSNGVSSDFDGNFTINVSNPNAILVVSFVGFDSQEISITGKNVINVALQEGAEALDEVNIVSFGYGTIKKENLLGSVASIGVKELENIPVTNVADALAGRLAGVSVRAADGAPGSEIQIRVRGGGSITQSNEPLYVVDGFVVSTISDIPPTDIQSIDVLKDAATTSIYGASAANGVVVITTKSAKAGKTTITYNHYTQLNTFAEERKFDVLSAYEYVQMQYEYAALKSDADVRNFEKYFGKYDDLELYEFKPSTDWQDDVFGSPTMSSFHNIGITGGSEETRFSLSLTNNDDEGLLVGSGVKRNVINFKLNHKISDRLKVDLSTRITHRVIDGGGTSGSSQLRIKNIVTARPTNGIADELEIDLNSVDPDDDYQSFLLNLVDPEELAKQDWRKRTDRYYVMNGGLTWDVTDNLQARTTLSGSRNFQETLRFYGPLTGESQKEGSSLPLGKKEDRENFSYRWTNTLNYNFDNLGVDHELDVLVGQEIYSKGGNRQYVRAENYRETITPEEMFASMNLGDIVEHSTYENTDNNLTSLFGKADYQFKDRYLFTATVRADWSSKFAKENRLGIFPAVSVGWKISNEAFLENSNVVDELKLRIGFGETGNNRIPDNSTKLLFSSYTNNGPGFGTNDYNGYHSLIGSTLYNPDLVWETTINRNIGLDFAFFNSRLSGSLDVYKNTTNDLLLKSAISPISGFSTQWNNIGNTSSKGVELGLNGIIVQNNDFNLSANFNFGINESRIEELDGTNDRFFQSNWASTDLKDRDDYYLKVGESIGMIYGYVNDGMYTVDDFQSYDETSGKYTLNSDVPDNKQTLGVANVRPGYMKLKDLNEDGLINSEDRQVIGNALPTAQGGFGLNATYKNFDFSSFFSWSVGNDVYNSGKIEYNQLYRSSYGNMLDNMNSSNRFTYIDTDGSYTGTAGGVVTDLAQLAELNEGKTMWSGSNSFGSATAVISDWAIEDGSYLRLTNATIGYTLPFGDLPNSPISKLRVYATGSNLFLWTKYSGYDPDVNTSRSDGYAALTPGLDYSSYPRSRTFTIGLNLIF